MFFPSKPLSIGGFPLPRWITEGSKLTLNVPVRKLAGHIISSNILGMNYNTSFTNRKENNTGMATPCQPLFQYRRSEVVAVSSTAMQFGTVPHSCWLYPHCCWIVRQNMLVKPPLLMLKPPWLMVISQLWWFHPGWWRPVYLTLNSAMGPLISKFPYWLIAKFSSLLLFHCLTPFLLKYVYINLLMFSNVCFDDLICIFWLVSCLTQTTRVYAVIHPAIGNLIIYITYIKRVH